MRDQEVIDFGWDSYIQQEEAFVDVGILAKDGAKKHPPKDGKQTDITLAELAHIQEFGTHIKVTKKMRGFLGANGLHLKADTAEIVIPSRPFMRQTFDEEVNNLAKDMNRLENEVLKRKKTRKEALEELGQKHKNQIQKAMATSGKFKANHPLTAERKGSNMPLIDEGTLRESIDYEVK